MCHVWDLCFWDMSWIKWWNFGMGLNVWIVRLICLLNVHLVSDRFDFLISWFSFNLIQKEELNLALGCLMKLKVIMLLWFLCMIVNLNFCLMSILSLLDLLTKKSRTCDWISCICYCDVLLDEVYGYNGMICVGFWIWCSDYCPYYDEEELYLWLNFSLGCLM